MELVSATSRVDGPCAILEQVYRLGHSELVQEIVLTAGGRRLDFRARVRWREVRSMLRSVPYPGPRLVRDEDVKPGQPHHGYTDQCDHRFTYALYPHPGDHVASPLISGGNRGGAGNELNVPLRVMPT
jgi:alpha-mannosidase